MYQDLHKFRHIDIFDTSLRDGEQSPGYGMGVEDKVRLALALEKLGINTIETGFPQSSAIDAQATREICQQVKKTKICGFARALAKDVKACAETMKDASNPQVQIASLGSEIHMKYKRKINREDVISEAIDAIKCAKAEGFSDISLAIEDATRSDIDFLKSLISYGMELGITSIAIPDTVGHCLPTEFFTLIKELRQFVGEDLRISIHCHNDMGLAVINSLSGILAGADEVQTTLCGIGERAGNASLEELISVLNSKQYYYKRVHTIVNKRIYDTCMLLKDIINIPIHDHKPILGRNAFSTEAGMHQQGVLNHRFTYEWLRAEDYGATPRIAVGRHSGRNIIKSLISSNGINDPDPILVDNLYSIWIETSDAKVDYSDDFWVKEYRKLQAGDQSDLVSRYQQSSQSQLEAS